MSHWRKLNPPRVPLQRRLVRMGDSTHGSAWNAYFAVVTSARLTKGPGRRLNQLRFQRSRQGISTHTSCRIMFMVQISGSSH